MLNDRRGGFRIREGFVRSRAIEAERLSTCRKASSPCQLCTDVHRTDPGCLRSWEAAAVELSPDEVAIEAGVMSDEHTICESLDQISRDLGKCWSALEISGANAVNIRASYITPRIHKGCVPIGDSSPRIEHDHADFDDSISGTETEACRFDIDHCE
jgi:hypothetical protein